MAPVTQDDKEDALPSDEELMLAELEKRLGKKFVDFSELDPEDRFVASEVVGDLDVRTDRLIRLFADDPIRWETMVFTRKPDGDIDKEVFGLTRQYSSKEDAIKGHAEVVEEVLASINENGEHTGLEVIV